MNLVFYSGGDNYENEALDERLMELLQKDHVQITYIPSSHDGGEEGYIDIQHYFEKYGVTKILYFPIDLPFTNEEKLRALESDAIYLSGGNTFYFLKHLRNTGLLGDLQEYVKSGGTLVGESAGSIILTPEIRTASFPKFDRDENEVNLKNWKGADLVNFEFFPHYKNSKRYDRELIAQSKKISGRPIYACPDGSGIIMKDGKVHFEGRVFSFYNGEKIRLQ